MAEQKIDEPISTANPPGMKLRRRTGPRHVRGYTRKFTARAGTGKNYYLEAVPAGLWNAARAQAKRDGFSMRGLILQLLTEYTERDQTK